MPGPGDPLPALVQEVGCPWPVTQALLLPTAGTDPADDFPSPSSALYPDCCRRRASRTAQALHTARHPNVGSRAASPPGISLISDVPFPPPWSLTSPHADPLWQRHWETATNLRQSSKSRSPGNYARSEHPGRPGVADTLCCSAYARPHPLASRRLAAHLSSRGRPFHVKHHHPAPV